MYRNFSHKKSAAVSRRGLAPTFVSINYLSPPAERDFSVTLRLFPILYGPKRHNTTYIDTLDKYISFVKISQPNLTDFYKFLSIFTLFFAKKLPVAPARTIFSFLTFNGLIKPVRRSELLRLLSPLLLQPLLRLRLKFLRRKVQ